MKIKKSTISLIVLALISIILITGSLFPIANNLDKNNGHLYIKNIGQEVYAQDDGGDDGGGDDGGGVEESDDSGDSEEGSEEEGQDVQDIEEEIDQQEKDYFTEENMDGSYAYEGENEATETPEERAFEAAEFKAEEEDDEATNKALHEENDGWYGGPKDSEGNLLDREDWPADAEYDNEDETGQLKVNEKGFREYLKDRDIDLDTDYYKYSPDEKKKMEEEYEEQKEDKYRDITTAGEDVEGFERFVQEKRGNGYDFDDNYHLETPEEQRKLEKEFNEMKLKRAAEYIKPSEQIPIKGVVPTIVKPDNNDRDKDRGDQTINKKDIQR